MKIKRAALSSRTIIPLKVKIRNSIKFKMIMIFVLIVFVMGSLIVGTHFIEYSSIKKLDGMIEVVIEANTVINEMKNIVSSWEDNDNSSYLDRLTNSVFASSQSDIDTSKELILDSIAKINSSLENLNEEHIKDERADHIVQRTNNYFSSFQEIISREHTAVDNNDITSVVVAKDEAILVGGFLIESVQELISNELTYSKIQKDYLNKQIELIRKIIIFVVLLVAILSIGISYTFTNKIAGSIHKLAVFSRKIAEGDFDVPDLYPEGHDELRILVNAFNIMKNNLSRSIAQIKESAEIKTKLKEKELENLRIINELNIAELKSLQSQINPHFLFNTLNSISRVAYFNNVPEVTKLIEALSDMIRYNLTNINKPSTLKQEINSLKNYLYIQKIRFGNIIEFDINVNSAHTNTLLPCLSLQPIIENAIIHGLEPYDYNGKITVNIYDSEEKFVIVEIADDGIGMEKTTLDKFIAGENTMDSSGHSTGIGISNVISRLNYFYNDSNIVTFHSELGEGTVVKLKLPIKEMGGK